MKHTGMPGVSIPLKLFPVLFPSPALPGSGSMGMISARYVQAPLTAAKVRRFLRNPKDDANATRKRTLLTG